MLRNDEKFINLVNSKTAFAQNLVEEYKNETDPSKKLEIEEKIDLEYEELANLFIGKMNIVWKDIQSKPDSVEKEDLIFEFLDILEQFEEDMNIELDVDYSDE